VTLRAVLIGLLGVILLSMCTYFNDYIMRQTQMIGNYMPISIFGSLIIFVILINPLFRRFAFTGRELAVALAITLVAGSIVGQGLMNRFTKVLMGPHDWVRTEPGWREEGVVALAPNGFLADPTVEEDVAVNGFVQGVGDGKGLPSVRAVPWGAWTKTLAVWIPLILALWIGMIALSVVTHRQWSDHEHLPYPVAGFANALLPDEGKATSSLFHSKLFWLGAAGVVAVHMNNYAYEWFPRQLVKIPTLFEMERMRLLWPVFARGGGRIELRIYFSAVAFAYFLASDVSFSVGIAQYARWIITGILLGYGVSLSGHGGLSPNMFANFGAYFGALLVLIYTGRHYYRNVFGKALFLPMRERVEPASLWGARVFLFSAALCAASLIFVLGLDWPLALLYVSLTFALFAVLARVVAETGLFYIYVVWYPGIVIWGLFGMRAMGPKPLLIMAVLTSAVIGVANEGLMPFMANSLKVLDLRKVKLGKPAVCCAIAVLICLAVAIPVTLAFNYDTGVSGPAAGWWYETGLRTPYKYVLFAKQRLAAQGNLEETRALSGLARFAKVSPNGPCTIAFGISLALFLLFSVARLRWRKWPIHPVLFLVWGRWSTMMFSSSFLLGWFIKVMVTKYGGSRIYQRLKPLMFGLIAGELLAGLIPMIVGAVYYFVTNLPPKTFYVLPL